MRNYSKTIIAAATALAAGSAFAGTPASAPAPAPAAAPIGELHVGYTTEYIWRGAEYGDDLVEAGVDLSTEWNGLGLSAGAWYGSVHNSTLLNGIPNVNIPDHLDELDLYGEVSKDFGFLKAHLGYIWYHFDQQQAQLGPVSLKLIDDRQEIYFGVSRELYWGIEGSLTYYWDVETDNGGYTELGFTKSFEVCPRSSLDLSWKTGYFVEEGEFSHTALVAAYNFKVTDTATLTPFVGVSVELDAVDEVFGATKIQSLIGGSNDQGNQLFGGVKFAVSF